MAYQLFDEVFPPTEALVQQGYAAYQAARCDCLIASAAVARLTAKAIKIITANPGPPRLLRRRQSEKRWRAAGGHQHRRHGGGDDQQRYYR